MLNLGDIPAGESALPIPFDTFAGATGASITASALATADIEVYKGVSMTQRASDNGYSLIDTDGIDLDGTTGIHGVALDLTDNSDAGFYAAGSWYRVVIGPITVDGQTINFTPAVFRIVPAETAAGVRKVDASHIEGSDATDQIRDAVVDDATRIDASALNTLSGHDPGETIMGATDLGTGAGLTSLATAAALATVDGNVDSILEDTGTTLPATLATIDGLAGDIKAKTDSLTFTSAGVVDANTERINNVAITGDGSGTPFGV